jgi:methylmalonyl-CoA mutase N-terminal domain/subunit
MWRLFDGIDLRAVSISMNINAPAASMRLAVETTDYTS